MDDAQFLVGRYAREQVGIAHARLQLGLGQGGDLLAGEEVGTVKRQCRDEMAHHRGGIARDDLDPHILAAQPRDGGRCGGLGRIKKRAIASEDQVPLILRPERIGRTIPFPPRDPQQAQALPGLVVMQHVALRPQRGVRGTTPPWAD
jgi:hypothetical protein